MQKQVLIAMFSIAILVQVRPVESEDLPPIALLYHNDPDVRIQTIRRLAESKNPELIDDLIRGYSVEVFTPVNYVYDEELGLMTGQKNIRGRGAWKAWLAAEASAGRLKIDYLPIDINSLELKQHGQIQSFATRLGWEHFKEMAVVLTETYDRHKCEDALRYMVANDNCLEVQEFLRGDWLSKLFSHQSIDINIVAYFLNGLVDPGLLRSRINAQIRSMLDSENATIVANTLHLLAGVEGYSTVFTVPDVDDKVRKLLESPLEAIALQARRAMLRINPASVVTYDEAFIDLYRTLGKQYPCFELKGTDWKAVGDELLPRAKKVKSDEEFGLLCLELVARLEDSHAQLLDGSAMVPGVSFPQWDPGFACLEDDQGRPAVYYIDPGGPAEQAGVKIGMVVISVNGEKAEDVIKKTMSRLKKYVGYSSERYLRYHAHQFFLRQEEKGATIRLQMLDGQAKTNNFELPAKFGVRYLPRLPVPNIGIQDAGSVSWKMLDGDIGYIYVRRIRDDLIPLLDKAIEEMKNTHGLIIDVRGNSGGGFEPVHAHLNFTLVQDSQEPERPRYKGPMALLIDSRCISAGEGWASWFVANKRARVFGQATAGASSRKITYELKNGLYKVSFPVKAYKGYLDRPIERVGLVPDVYIRQNAQDLVECRDTVLEAARQYLVD